MSIIENKNLLESESVAPRGKVIELCGSVH